MIGLPVVIRLQAQLRPAIRQSWTSTLQTSTLRSTANDIEKQDKNCPQKFEPCFYEHPKYETNIDFGRNRICLDAPVWMRTIRASRSYRRWWLQSSGHDQMASGARQNPCSKKLRISLLASYHTKRTWGRMENRVGPLFKVGSICRDLSPVFLSRNLRHVSA